jgi:nucleotide-binding universal stress UspA family protein
MRYCDILLHLTDDTRSAEKTATALNIAARFNAAVTAVYTLPFPSQLYYMGDYVPPAFFQQQMDEAKDAANAARKAFESSAKEAGVHATWAETEQMPLDALQAWGRSCDLAVIGQPDPDRSDLAMNNLGTATLPADLALALGRPLLTVPYIGQYPAPGKSVVVAWNDSREAARAVHDALPLLAGAGSVTIFGINPDAADEASAARLVAHLGRYGIVAKAKHAVVEDIAAGEALLSTLADHSADMLVMGAYGHSRLREMVLGGVTRTILQSMTVPVLLGN